jgi:hypothetical protein
MLFFDALAISQHLKKTVGPGDVVPRSLQRLGSFGMASGL